MDAADRAQGPATRPFRPRRTRVVCAVLVPLVLAGAVLLELVLPDVVVVADRVSIVVVALVAVELLRRQAAVVAVPDSRGLLVRNLVRRRRFAWAQVVEVRFGGGQPWAQLDLADGTTWPVMAVQRADGPRAAAEASRLAALVVAGST